MLVGIIQFVEGLNRAKRQRKGKFAVCFSWDIHLLLVFLDISTLGSLIFGHRLNYTTSFPGSPTCRQQITGLLSLYNHVVPIINK